jgi:putative transposase
MGGFKQGQTAARFCRAFDEVRAFLRPQSRRNQPLSLAQHRDIYRDRFGQLMAMLAAA